MVQRLKYVVHRHKCNNRVVFSSPKLSYSYSTVACFNDYLSIHSAGVSPSAFFAAFFLVFLFSLSARVKRVFNSSSSTSFSVLMSSGLYQTGGWLIKDGPPGKRAMVKWNPATNVFDGVYLSSKKMSKTGWMVDA